MVQLLRAHLPQRVVVRCAFGAMFSASAVPPHPRARPAVAPSSKSAKPRQPITNGQSGPVRLFKYQGWLFSVLRYWTRNATPVYSGHSRHNFIHFWYQRRHQVSV